MNTRSMQVVLLAMLVLFHCPALQAQSLLLPAPLEDSPVIGLRFMRPNFSSALDISVLNGTYDLYADIPLSFDHHLLFAVPFSYFPTTSWGWYDGFQEDDELALGNLYLGLSSHWNDNPAVEKEFEVGVWLPTADNDSANVHNLGMFANFTEVQRLFPDVVTVYTNYSFLKRGPDDVAGAYGFQIGPELLVPTGDGGGDSELFLHYALSAGLRSSEVSLDMQLLGQFWVTEDMDRFSDAFTHALAFGAQFTGAAVRPGVFFLIPLEDATSAVIDYSLGFKVDVVLP